MGRYIIAIVFSFASLLSMAMISENPDSAITVKFKEFTESAEVAGILSVMDVSQVTAKLFADSLDAKFYEIWMVERKGSETKRTKLGYKGIEPDSTKITFTAIAKDSLNAVVSIVRLNAGSPRVEVSVPTANHLLIGCDYDWKFTENDTIPLVGYATGIPTKYDLGNGKIFDAFYICGIRFSKVQPYNWKDEYDLSDYLYFEAIPVKEMNF